MQTPEASYPYLSPALPRIFAHRGFAAAPGLVENTIPAFQAALELGATHIESDIQVTKDGIAVLFHDDDLTRVAGLPQKISEIESEQLLAIDLGGGVRIPTLREALTTLPEASFNLDLKVFGAIDPSVAIIRELEAEHRVLLTSFSEARRNAAILQFTGSVASSAGGARVLGIWLAAKLRFNGLVRHLAAPVQALQIPTRSGLIRFDSPGFITAVSSAGLELHYWIINEPAERQRLIARGAHGIVTDRTDLAVNTLGKPS
jgi:glycerophosphoryl diester phosphodiesterase